PFSGRSWFSRQGSGCQAEVEQPAGGLHHQIHEPRPDVAEGVRHDAEDLHSTDTVLHLHSHPGDQPIGLLLFGSQLLAPGLLLRLVGPDTFWLISLEAAVLVQPAALREDVAIVVSTGLVMAATGVGRPKTDDLATGLVGDHDVLLGVPFLLAAVVLPAPLAVPGTPDRPLGTI